VRKSKLESSPFFMFIILWLNDEVGFERKNKFKNTLLKRKNTKNTKNVVLGGWGWVRPIIRGFWLFGT